MRRVIGWVVGLLAATSCSQSLPFDFTFGSTDTGDLAAPQSDLGIADLGHALDGAAADLTISSDLATSIDLTSVADLRSAKDLVSLPDLTPLSLLGAACNPSDFVPCGVVGQLECMTFFKNQSSSETTAIADGYCSKTCERDEDCVDLKGLCRPMAGSGLRCMPACDGSCARDNYACCFHCPSGPSCTAGAVCAPPSVPDYNSCIAANP